MRRAKIRWVFTMAEKDGGVQIILGEKYTRTLYFHSVSHKLNLVVNDLNNNFFRESSLHRKCIQMLCETRWSQKYTSIKTIMCKSLWHLKHCQNRVIIKQATFPMNCAATRSEFIIYVCIVAKYLTLLQPEVNTLQSKTIGLFQYADHIKRITGILKNTVKILMVKTEVLYPRSKQCWESWNRIQNAAGHKSAKTSCKFTNHSTHGFTYNFSITYLHTHCLRCILI